MLDSFDWGWMNEPSNRTLSSGNITKNYSQWHKDAITQEIFQDKMYEKFFEVEEDPDPKVLSSVSSSSLEAEFSISSGRSSCPCV